MRWTGGRGLIRFPLRWGAIIVPVPKVGKARNRMRTNLPKTTFLKFSLYVSEWLLLSDDSESWVQEERVLIAWHFLFFCSLGLWLLNNAPLVAPDWLAQSVGGTLAYRLCRVLLAAILIPIFVALVTRFYKHLLLTNRDLRFSSLTFFWILWVTIYGMLYHFLYDLSPVLFTWPHALYVPTPTYIRLPWLIRIQSSGVFYTYSGCISTALSFPFVNSNSLLVSILNISEAVGSISFIALVVGTFAGKKMSAKQK
jgi:hypothetical protein